jgi:hypothetical protein
MTTAQTMMKKRRRRRRKIIQSCFLNMLYKVTEELLRVAVSALIALFHTVK